MKVKSLSIEDVGGVQSLHLRFTENLNLICGPNGVGKTTILDCIGQSFSVSSASFPRRNSRREQGTWTIVVDDRGQERPLTYNLTNYHPGEQSPGATFRELARHVLTFKTHRTFDYQPLQSVNRDADRNDHTVGMGVWQGVVPADIKSWFVNRYMWSAHADRLTPEQVHNFGLAQQCFQVVEETITFSRVIPDTFEIQVDTPRGEIYFEYLSAGYKSVLAVLLGLIKEIELRYKDPRIKVDDFDGVILIDEIDLHLHPEWQSRLIQSMKKLVPHAQIIATTHSPHMVQVAAPNEILPLGYDNLNEVCLRDVPAGEFGYQGWTVDEILVEVMGLKETTSEIYRQALEGFNAAVEAEDPESAMGYHEQLDKMLHPANPLRKLLKLQLASIGDAND